MAEKCECGEKKEKEGEGEGQGKIKRKFSRKVNEKRESS